MPSGGLGWTESLRFWHRSGKISPPVFLDDDDLADALERDADERYGVLLPSDAVLNAAFRACLKEAPDAFARPEPDAAP
jgi:hypothetical protein